MSTTAALTAKELEQIDRAQYQKALESIKLYVPGLKRKAADRKKMERRNRLFTSNTAAKPRPTEKPATANNNAGVNWNLINNLPHNLDADEATGTNPEADTPAWHIIENLDHNIEVDSNI